MCETDCVTAAGRKQQTARLASSSERESQNLDSNMLREKKCFRQTPHFNDSIFQKIEFIWPRYWHLWYCQPVTKGGL